MDDTTKNPLVGDAADSTMSAGTPVAGSDVAGVAPVADEPVVAPVEPTMPAAPTMTDESVAGSPVADTPASTMPGVTEPTEDDTSGGAAGGAM